MSESKWKFHGVRVVHANELDTNTFSLLEDTLGGGQTGEGPIVLLVYDTANMPVAGAAVVANPA